MEKEKRNGVLHVVVFPWLAMGHLIPFFRLSKLIAQKGHTVSFISTPRNILRLPKIPSHLSSLINLVSLPLPRLDNLPNDAESSTDVPYNGQQLLKRAFDLLELPLTDFLGSSESKPDWVIYDYASHWLPPVAARFDISRAFFSCFSAACLAYIGPPAPLVNGQDFRTNAEDFTLVPEWVPFESDMAYRLHEIAKYLQRSSENESVTPDTVRFGFAINESEVVFIRSSDEFEPEWFNLLREIYGKGKPVVPIGFLPPPIDEQVDEFDTNWVGIKEWLDKQRVNSVIYIAVGTEAILSQEELTELALGLELSGVPFFWVLRNPPESTQYVFEMLPHGFVERVEGRGVVHLGWAPQVRILSHDSVGGFLTHCGWNSMIEGLGFGRVLILFPMVNDQGLNARLGNNKGLGVEIPRIAQDGSFTRDSVAKLVRFAMVEDSGESLRNRAKEMKGLFGDRNRNNQIADEFICFLEENSPPRLTI
ncbi:PREDICTED: UDP-glycosyltransferase 91C1 [Prunus mume]|uniref:UDP-glycosyltransferase 91C1 n=1 Tax=Prunus mume TaxID=102107 RepID=A0ABM0N423_PRUMU|nr:PREDICTED: UDP-glycosyltransferase 91C1 [Prunus mume]